MKLLLLALAGLMAMAVVACGGGATSFEKGKLVTGTITASDSNMEGWNSEPYVVELFGGIEYFVRLTSINGNIMGIWSVEGDEYIVEIDSDVAARTVAYTFSETGPQELFLRSPKSDIPADFTFTIWEPSGT